MGELAGLEPVDDAESVPGDVGGRHGCDGSSRDRRQPLADRHVRHEAWELLFKLLLAPILVPLWILRRLL